MAQAAAGGVTSNTDQETVTYQALPSIAVTKIVNCGVSGHNAEF